jgi:hypothetical protein
MIKFGRYPDRDVSQLAAQAGWKRSGRRGRDEAIGRTAGLYATSGSNQRILQQMGRTGISRERRQCVATEARRLPAGGFAIASGV